METTEAPGMMSYLRYFVFSSPITIALLVFQVWMIIDAIRRRD